MIALDPVRPAARSLCQRFGLPVLLLLGVATAALGTFGFATRHNQAVALDLNSLAEAFYRSLQLFTVEFDSKNGPVTCPLQIARFLAPLLTITALARALAGVFRAEWRGFRLAHSRRHIVVCGAGTKATALIRDYCQDRSRVVIIDQTATQTLPDVSGRADLFAISGDATSEEALGLARAGHAARVFITTGNDSANIEIAAGLISHCKTVGPRPGRVICHVHLVDPQTEELFKRHRIFKDATDRVEILTFNVYDNAARLLWRERLMACGPLAPEDKRRLHVVLGGLGQMGEAVLLRLVRSAHYANGLKPSVTVIDLHADARRQRLLDRVPALPRFCDLEFIEADLSLPATARRISAVCAEPGQLGAVVLCMDDDHANFSIALQLAPHLKTLATPIYIRLSRAAGLCDLLRAEHSEAALARQIDGFGLVSTCCTRELVTTDLLSETARAIHKVFTDSQAAAGASSTDTGLQPWDALSETFREANREQAEHMELKLRTFGFSATGSEARLPAVFSDSQTDILGRMEHARWRAERELSGWTYAAGPKDAENRTSPYLVPWEQLDAATREKDLAFVRAIPHILAQAQDKTGWLRKLLAKLAIFLGLRRCPVTHP